MADEIDLDLGTDTEEQEQISKSEKRIKSLSEKVKLTSDERDKELKAREKAEKAAEDARKEAEFYKGFNQISSKYQGAGDLQDKIREKVNAGYSMEDAARVVLMDEGKFNPPPPPPPPPPQSPIGGSAVNNLGTGEKTITDMTQEERRKELESKLTLSL